MSKLAFTWADLKSRRESVRETQIESVMQLVQQYPFVDVYLGEIPPISAIEAAKRYPLCDGVLIIFKKQEAENGKDDNRE